MKRVALAIVLGLLACSPRGARTPEAARDAYLGALRADDPATAYALLAPDVRARVDYESFLGRWRADAAEREATIAAAAKLGRADVVASHAATTVHDGGMVLHWAWVDGRWLVTGGLPPTSRASTPAEAIRGFLAALAAGPLGAAQGFLAPELADALRADWAARSDAIEAALAKPGAVELSEDLLRAQVRYDPQRVVVLEQTAHGWVITRFE